MSLSGIIFVRIVAFLNICIVSGWDIRESTSYGVGWPGEIMLDNAERFWRRSMPDFNPDRDGHLSDKYMVIKATKDREMHGVELDGQEMKFGRDGAFAIKGHARANALRQKYQRGEVVVTRMRHSVEPGHRYFFTVPRLPWKEGSNGKEETQREEKEVDSGGD